MQNTDTIVAIATPPGQGALGIVRMSGPQAFDIADRLFSGKTNVSEFDTHTVHCGRVVSGNELIDNVLLTKMDSPRTYTGENSVELTCHGGRLILHKVLTTAIASGARPAEPGEFTMRAFMNGKLDLAQAEAVQQFISAENELAFRTASQQLMGKLSCTIEGFRKDIVKVLAATEASIDFPEEDIEYATNSDMIQRLSSLRDDISNLADTYADGRRIAEGVRVTIAGKPNVGKSSLLNALLEKDRAIITHLPGTTRDLLHESLIWQGITLRITDTAGIRESENLIEKEGVFRSNQAIDEADLVLFVIDSSIPITDEDIYILSRIKIKNHIVVLNKSDLPKMVSDYPFPDRNTSTRIPVSALANTGITELKDLIVNRIWECGIPAGDMAIITSARHKAALDETAAALSGAIKDLSSKCSPEFVALHLREALGGLEMIVGRTTTDDILDEIFATFCIGK